LIFLQWKAEKMTTEELKSELPDKQLRACEIMEQSTLLCKQADEAKVLSKNNLLSLLASPPVFFD
jgi:hypothetical protein